MANGQMAAKNEIFRSPDYFAWSLNAHFCLKLENWACQDFGSSLYILFSKID
jgi:hypothetical protein